MNQPTNCFVGQKDNRIIYINERAGLKLKPMLCHLFKDKVTFVGHTVSREGISVETRKTHVVVDYPKPRTVAEVHSVTGFANYHNDIILHFIEIARPLQVKLRVRMHLIVRNWRCQIPFLVFPNWNIRFKLTTDFSDKQESDGRFVSIAYASRELQATEKYYPTSEKELLAIVWATRKYRDHL